MGDSSSPVAGKFEKIKGILINVVFFIILYIIICLGTLLYARFVSDRGDPTSMWYKLPKWVQPSKFWKKTFGIDSNEYLFIPSSVAVTATSISGGTFSNVSVNDCILECEAESPDCIGFLYNKTSNTCYLSSLIDGIMPSDASNVVYFIEDSGPTKQYFKTDGKIPATPVANAISSLIIDTTTNVATFTTMLDHSFVTGNRVMISGASYCNGSNIITATDSTHFTIPYATTVTSTASLNGTATLVLTTTPPVPDITSALECAADCSSNVSCTGFSYGPGQCIEYTTIPFKTSMLTQASATSNTYIPGVPKSTAYTAAYY